MTLKVYTDWLSQPSLAVILFCKLNGIDFEEVNIEISKRHQKTPEFCEINPLKQVPAIVDGNFKLSESHAILIYLACVFPGVADHWYPTDVLKRVKIHSVLDWHPSNLRCGQMILSPVTYGLHTTIGPLIGLRMNPDAASEAKKLLSASLAKIESVWLKGNGRFLLESLQPSIADLSLVCEIMQLEVPYVYDMCMLYNIMTNVVYTMQLLEEEDRARILGPHKKVTKWIDDTRSATQPHFDEVYSVLFSFKEDLKKQRSIGKTLHSKI